MKQAILNNIKNIYGWKTKRKIVVISVDDYGNVRLDSKLAREKMNKVGLKVLSRFDAFDTLETTNDLEMLYDVLCSVKDKYGKHASFTPYALPANINFERMQDEGNKRYIYELLPETYSKLEGQQPNAYNGTWKLWEEGIEKGLMKPQFHGREHLNLKVFDEKLKAKDLELLTALSNRSFASISSSGYSTIAYTAAFDFWQTEENQILVNILEDGLDKFAKVFGYKAKNFMSPRSKIFPGLLPIIKKGGIDYVDIGFIHNQHMGGNKYSKSFNYTGKINDANQINMVRNVVFEPTNGTKVNWVDSALKQVEVAFFWNKPAIISSHRVNYCGHISVENRKLGLSNLRVLLKRIVQRWPEVEFKSANELGEIITLSLK